jgi:hypothetical protein
MYHASNWVVRTLNLADDCWVLGPRLRNCLHQGVGLIAGQSRAKASNNEVKEGRDALHATQKDSRSKDILDPSSYNRDNE